MLSGGNVVARRAWTKLEERRLVLMEIKLLPRSQIAEELGRTRRAVDKRLYELGQTGCRRRRPNGALIKLVKRLYKRGWGDVDIADHIGDVSRQAVTAVRTRLGLPCGMSKKQRSRYGRALQVLQRWPEGD